MRQRKVFFDLFYPNFAIELRLEIIFKKETKMLLSRRALIGLIGLLATAQAPAQKKKPAGLTRKFSGADVVQAAQGLAQKPFIKQEKPLPAALAALNFDKYRDLRFKADKAFMADTPFKMQLFHRGFLYKDAVAVNSVKENSVTPLNYAPSLFQNAPTQMPPDLGFAGFRLHYALNDPRVQDELISFLGASYFRFLGRGQRYGLSARGLAIDAGGKEEEFPVFKEFWVESSRGDSLTLHALLDSPSLTGAFRFAIFPETATILDVQATLFARKTLTRLGLSPLTSMFLQAENDRRVFNDYRSELHDSDGLQVHLSTGEWLWRPLHNPVGQEVSSFGDKAIRGFGLMQRDRIFEHYQDLDLNYELRPSYWCELLEGFGEGRVELVEMPTVDETNDNIVASFIPAKPLEAGQSLVLKYRIHATKDENKLHTGGKAVNTFRTKAVALGSGETVPAHTARFIIDFAGGELDFYQNALEKVELIPSASEGKIIRAFLVLNPKIKGFRATFDVQGEKGKTVNMRCFLRSGTKALTETWTMPWKVDV
jgi:periplasmic glucans biosynthesis protein